MSKNLKSILLILGIVTFAIFVNPVYAQEKMTPAQQFEQWKATIPDYEKRLYDRVKSVNKRTVRIQSAIIIGFSVLFLFMIVLLIRQGGGVALNANFTSGMSPKILRNQRTLITLLSELKEFQNSKQNDADDFSRLIKSSERQLAKLQEEIETEGNEKVAD